MNIGNDKEFRAELDGLFRDGRRMLGARFAQNVKALSNDARVKVAIEAATRADITADELDAAFQSARAGSVDSFTRCGHECNWNSQAGHFVAQAALAALKPDEAGNAAWESAMHARMARTCAVIAAGNGTENAETLAQYRIAMEFLND